MYFFLWDLKQIYMKFGQDNVLMLGLLDKNRTE